MDKGDEKFNAWVERVVEGFWMHNYYPGLDMDLRRALVGFKDHQLTETIPDREWVIHKPAENGVIPHAYSTRIAHLGGRLIITGDVYPGQRGVIGDLSYGISWFGGQIAPQYLAEKFFRKVWAADVFWIDIKHHLKDLIHDAWGERDRDLVAEAKQIRDFIKDNEHIYTDDGEKFFLMPRIYDILGDTDYSFGYEYPLWDLTLLYAIQRTYRRLKGFESNLWEPMS
jgi:hypothetical protein